MNTLTNIGLIILALTFIPAGLFFVITAIVGMIKGLVAAYRRREWGEIIAWAWITLAIIGIVLVLIGSSLPN